MTRVGREPWRPRLVGIAMRERARQESWTETAALCPECNLPTIHRIGGEWCRWCRGFIEEITLRSSTVAGEKSHSIRTLRNGYQR